MKNNLGSTTSLLKVMNQAGVKKLVFSSSATVYGVPESVPMKEDFPMGFTNPYGATKYMIEQMLKDLFVSDGEWKISILRYFNPVGAHPSGLIGELPNGIPNNLMPFILQVASGQRDMLSVFGNDFDTVDGTGVRDYIHVMDLVDGHVKALEYLDKSNGAEVFNLGTGKGISVLEMIEAFKQATEEDVPYKIVGRRAGDIDASFADPTKANKILGWSTKKSVRDMCSDAWRWQSNNPNGFD